MFKTSREVKKMFKRKGQSTLEYAIIVAVVVGALLAMQHYVKRGYQGRLKSASDEMGEQFDPAAYTADLTVTQSSEVKQTVKDKVANTQYTKDAIANKTGTENLEAWEKSKDVFDEPLK
jgi:uncharacterized protein (UPF0333 family)